jgi:phosphopantothenoylcysteine decarboxylase/phosphopantothenate--cysteine ligase
MSLANKKIIVGITGGIAAYKTPNLIRLLKKADVGVRAVMTEAATRFITPLTIETVSQNPVSVKMFPDQFAATHHIDLARWPDLFVIAPATANFLGKAASGICDDLLSTVICATKKPVMIAPAMNTDMYFNPVTQKNMEYLKSLGYLFISPDEGELACETEGWGRMSEPEEIFETVKSFFQKKKPSRAKKSS